MNKIINKTERAASFSFLFMQVMTWLLGGLPVELKLIAYPVRFFDYAYRTSFTFEYFVFPVVSVLFNLYFPNERSRLQKLLYIILFPSAITAGEVALEKYTNVIDYVKWEWYWSWITITITLYLSYMYYKWFFVRKNKKGFR